MPQRETSLITPLTRAERAGLGALLGLVLLGVLSGAVGCISGSTEMTYGEPPIQLKLSHYLSRLTPGMSVAEATEILDKASMELDPERRDLASGDDANGDSPTAESPKPSKADGPPKQTELIRRGRSQFEGGWIDAYEVTRERIFANGEARRESLWLYFHNDALVRWGPPGDWPRDGDFGPSTQAR